MGEASLYEFRRRIGSRGKAVRREEVGCVGREARRVRRRNKKW
jgi:hypothetical protein